MVRRHLPLGIFYINCYRVINIILSFWGFYQCEAKFVLNSKIFSQRALAVSGIHHCRSWPKNFCSKKEKRTFYSWMSCESNFQKKNKEKKKKNSVWSISHKMWCHRPFIKSKCSKTAQQKVSYYRNYTLNTPSLIYFGELTDELLLYQLTKGSDVYIFYFHNPQHWRFTQNSTFFIQLKRKNFN